ncbi:hypothetical protein CIPAW_01G114700 [Carya illinoinensis]|uniref:Glycosyltransferase n=1 Tax=Carya illinoinensis TaxID=32201 RepID=A0A8T1RL98_CARIL|nr:hypothetical protein CIPAW_01G114700 [Carya illinoinensis]
MEKYHHVLVITFPVQGHINPTFQFAKRLICFGAHVTLITSISGYRCMTKSTPSTPQGLSFATFSDGYNDGFKHATDDVGDYMSVIKHSGSKTLTDLIMSNANEGRLFQFLVYTLIMPWAGKVASELHLPSALLWIQPTTVLDIYYYYFNGYGDDIREKGADPSYSLQLPGLSLLYGRDLPSFLLDLTTHTFALPLFQEQLEALEKESNSRVLVNTFDALEPEGLRDPFDKASGGDLFQDSKEYYIEWLNSKPNSSIIYISFGSLSMLAKQQMEEMACGLLDCSLPFLWVIRREQKGMIVPWCSQVEVLSHPSLACFVTHCGWNSSLESLVSGVLVVAFPQWTDQVTNAKLIEDVWETGLRVIANKDGIVEGDEIKRCLELVAGGGEQGGKLRRNATKWKDLAREAAKEGGSSYKNLQAFVEEIGGRCS